MIILDYNQVCIASILAFGKDLRVGGDAHKQKDLIRHVALSSIKSYKKKYGKKYGDIVIACDGRGYWRKEAFKYYKAQRAAGREESDLDWGMVFDTLSEIRDDLKQHFPYKVLHLDRCEADDVIAVLAKLTQEFGRFEEVMVVSSDKDFKQLLQYDNVAQFSPMLKKQITVNKKQLREWMIEHIVKGDSGDGVPNILTVDNAIVDKIRQTPVRAARLAEFQKLGIDACQNDTERRNWQRNEMLVSFDHIPQDIADMIIEAFDAAKPGGNKTSVMNYLIRNRCKLLLDEVDEF